MSSTVQPSSWENCPLISATNGTTPRAAKMAALLPQALRSKPVKSAGRALGEGEAAPEQREGEEPENLSVNQSEHGASKKGSPAG